MAKLQIFVLIVALAYSSAMQISTMPGVLPAQPSLRPQTVVSITDVVAPPCVASVRALLQAIMDKLPTTEEEIEVPTEPELEDEPVSVETPCTACFEHISNLLNTAEKVIAVRRMSALMRRH